MAHVAIVREGVSGVNLVGFLVDTLGLGLKDGYVKVETGKKMFERGYLDEAHGGKKVEINLELAQELVYGGVLWAKEHGFTPSNGARSALKFLPPPVRDPDLSLFGRDGKPLLILSEPDL